MGTEESQGFTLQRVTDPEELKLAERLSVRLDLIDSLVQRFNRVSGARMSQRSELAADDRITAWRHMSHNVTGALNLAVDNLTAFRRLLQTSDGLLIPQFAHYSLLRPALEGGSLALWILESDEPRTRVERLLRAAAAEINDENALTRKLIGSVGDQASVKSSRSQVQAAHSQRKTKYKKHTDQIRGVARSLGIPDPTLQRWTVGYAEVVSEATRASGVKPEYGEVTWRIVSSLCHPSLTGATSRSSVEELSDNGDGTLNALLTSDLALTRVCFEAAYLNAWNALELLGMRKLRPADPASYPNRNWLGRSPQ